MNDRGPKEQHRPRTEDQTAKVRKLQVTVEPWQWLVATILVVVSGYFGFQAWIRSVATDAVLNEKFLGELAAKVRPSCVFDFNGSILAEVGTQDYVSRIRVETNGGWSYFVFVDCKRHLNYPPIIQYLNKPLHTVESVRSTGYGWKITMNTGVLVTEDYPTNNPLYKLEILH